MAEMYTHEKGGNTNVRGGKEDGNEAPEAQNTLTQETQEQKAEKKDEKKEEQKPKKAAKK